MKRFERLIANYSYELLRADVLLTADHEFQFNEAGNPKNLLNRLIGMENCICDAVSNLKGEKASKMRQVNLHLESLEQVFYLREDQRIWHKHLYFKDENGWINDQKILLKWEPVLVSYLDIQYESLLRLKRMFPSELIILPECYGWNDKIISLYEMLNVLWAVAAIVPLGANKSKKAYFTYFFNVLGIEEKPENYSIRIAEVNSRKDAVLFLHKLIKLYLAQLDALETSL